MLGLSVSRDEVRVPSGVVWPVLPGLATFVLLIAYSLILSIILGPSSDFNILEFLPQPVAIGVVVWGVYAGFCAVVLWVAMWMYWAAIERSSYGIRVGWFLVLLFGMPLGSMAYAVYLWKKGKLKVVTSAAPQYGLAKPLMNKKRSMLVLVRVGMLLIIGLAYWATPSSFPLWSFVRIAMGAILVLEAAVVIAFRRRSTRAYISLAVLVLIWIAILR